MSSNFDEALERLRGTGTEVVSGGDPNHGPMAAEALVALGREDAAVAWVERYRRRLGPLQARPTSRIAAEDWQSTLGRVDRIADWATFFREQLALASWSTVLRTWLPRLLPGAIAAGLHGLIRTAHIARALGREETSPRLEELASALAYWAAYYRELPEPARLIGPLPPELALERVPRVARVTLNDGMPRERVFVVGGHPAFLAAVEAAGAPSSIDAGLSALTEMGARVYLTNGATNPLVLLHTVTGPAALRLLLPHLEKETRMQAFAALYHSSAALVAAYADAGELVPSDWAPATTRAEIVDRCIDTDDPHAIKLIEACLREEHLSPRPIYLAAALDWATRMHAAKDWTPAQLRAAGLAFG